MNGLRRLLVGGTVAVCLLGLSGCAQLADWGPSRVLHEFKPYRLWRWNRGPAPSQDVYFSVPDRPG